MIEPNFDPFEDGSILDCVKVKDSFEAILKKLYDNRNEVNRQIREVLYIIELIEKDTKPIVKHVKTNKDGKTK